MMIPYLGAGLILRSLFNFFILKESDELFSRKFYIIEGIYFLVLGIIVFLTPYITYFIKNVYIRLIPVLLLSISYYLTRKKYCTNNK